MNSQSLSGIQSTLSPLTLLVPTDSDMITADDYVDWPAITHDNTTQSIKDYSFAELDTTDPIDYIDIDLDNTCGDVSIITVFIKIYKYFTRTPELPPYSMFQSWFFQPGAMRPHLPEFFQFLQRLKTMKKIQSIRIHTSLKQREYIQWMVKCLEQYCNTPDLIDQIIDGTTAESSACGATIKRLEPNTIIFDDKPWNAQPSSRAIGVSMYMYTTDASQFYQYFDKKDHPSIKKILANDAYSWNDRAVNLQAALLDNDLGVCIDGLSQLFDLA